MIFLRIALESITEVMILGVRLGVAIIIGMLLYLL